jgi:nitrite reductase (NADH) large subunit
MKYTIIGNGVAGTTAASAIRKNDPDGEITILTEEAVPFYSRIRLIEYLAKEADLHNIIIHKDDWYARQHMKLLLNSRVTGINKEKKNVLTGRGETFPYDKLLLAAGGMSFLPPIPGSDKKGVFTLRSVQDADEIMQYAEGKKRVVLIGGGVLGLEAGNSLRKRGLEITVVEFFPRLLPRQMDPEGAAILRAQMEGMGFTFFLDAKTREITGDKDAEGVLLEDGTSISCDLIVISAGVRPRAELAAQLGLTVNKGIKVNDRMETEISDVYAAGDLIEHRERFYGIWAAAQRQGEIAGVNMSGGDAVYEGTTMSNVLKVVGIDMAAAGDIDADSRHESIIYKNDETHIYRKVVIQDHILAGCILYGDISGYQKILKAIEEKRNIEEFRDYLDHWNESAS